VARAFPGLLESRIVLEYSSFFLSKEQTHKINPAYHSQRMTRRSRPAYEWTDYRQVVHRTLASLGLWLTSCILFFGSQSIIFQEAAISLTNPGLVTVIAFIGIKLMKASFVGIPVGAVLVVPVLGLMMLCGRYLMNRVRQEVSEAEDEHKNITLYEQELLNTRTHANDTKPSNSWEPASHEVPFDEQVAGKNSLDYSRRRWTDNSSPDSFSLPSNDNRDGAEIECRVSSRSSSSSKGSGRSHDACSSDAARTEDSSSDLGCRLVSKSSPLRQPVAGVIHGDCDSDSVNISISSTNDSTDKNSSVSGPCTPLQMGTVVMRLRVSAAASGSVQQQSREDCDTCNEESKAEKDAVGSVCEDAEVEDSDDIYTVG
jgi:hypothetical protein